MFHVSCVFLTFLFYTRLYIPLTRFNSKNAVKLFNVLFQSREQYETLSLFILFFGHFVDSLCLIYCYNSPYELEFDKCCRYYILIKPVRLYLNSLLEFLPIWVSVSSTYCYLHIFYSLPLWNKTHTKFWIWFDYVFSRFSFSWYGWFS